VFNYVTGLVFAYDSARKENADLRRRLAETMRHAAQRKELQLENRRLRQMLAFERNESGLKLEPVEIIETFKGILMVDRGSAHEVEKFMCAVTDRGIVGLVTQVDLATANVATLHNADCRVSAMIDRNRVRGIVHGTGSDLSRYATMKYIDMKDDVRENDLVVTSPESVFPTGYPIGRVVNVDDTGSLWKTADIELAVDPYRLDEVFLLRQAVTPVEELAGPAPEEPAHSVAPATPDKRTLQDRYAP